MRVSYPVSIALCLASLCVVSPSVQADDEGSEHTAELYGDDADTIGVYVKFDTKVGWGMTFRPRPGAATLDVPLAFLPADHAHYAVVVGPDRRWLTFITQSRAELDAKTTAVWTMNAKGTIVKTWTFGDVMTESERAHLQRSVSHTSWLTAAPIVGGHRIELRLATHRMIVAPLTSELRRMSLP